MPRRQYVADLQKASGGVVPTAVGIHDVQKSEDDGQFQFAFATSTLTVPASSPFVVTAMVTDLSEYPKSHSYLIFASEDTPPAFAAALQRIRDTNGKTVSELLCIVSAALVKLQQGNDSDLNMPDSQQYELESEEEDEIDIYDDDHEAFASDPHGDSRPTLSNTPRGISTTTSVFRARIRSDLRATKKAGFRVAHLGHLLDGHNAFVVSSIRIGKLGISEEAMQAWQVEPSEYLMLIIQYPNGYQTSEQLKGYDSQRLKSNLGIRVCVGKRYKPTLQQAMRAFTKAQTNPPPTVGTAADSLDDEVENTDSIRDTFISKSLVSLMEDRLMPLMRNRSIGMPWSGAEDFINDYHGVTPESVPAMPEKYFLPEPVNDAYPRIVNADHFASTKMGQEKRSFPLVAMQFLLRHFVRCTEFCLVCHRKLVTDVEAIKPYVCGADLCLFQYMAMGMGPTIEHEIIAQPYVVDLLISFCYSQAHAKKLKHFPNGLALTVPPVAAPAVPAYDYYSHRSHVPSNGRQPLQTSPPKSGDLPKAYEVGFDRANLELLFRQPHVPETCPLKRGDWIVLKTVGNGALGEIPEFHCRVSDVTFFPSVAINEPLVVSSVTPPTIPGAGAEGLGSKPFTPDATPKWANAEFHIYNQDCDALDDISKCAAICRLMDTLPSVRELKNYLINHRPPDLKRWVDRVSPAAMSLLRWIIASNRACIMQIDDGGKTRTVSSARKEERLFGMKDWVQFRFAMGAPDKEQRFIKAVQETKKRLSLTYPTLFAWHGSPLHNWHSIIREGLHYRETAHGRAYGNGVYHAPDVRTSLGYSDGAYNRVEAGTDTWPHSQLRIATAMALNEIVNAPAEYVSQSPHYVVAHLDWIQTRYLFVKCFNTPPSIKDLVDVEPKKQHPQDPKRTPHGVGGKIAIPAGAIKSGRVAKAQVSRTERSPMKRLKGAGGFNDPIVLDDPGWDVPQDVNSDESDVEDLEILFDDDPTTVKASQDLDIALHHKAVSLTGFVSDRDDSTSCRSWLTSLSSMNASTTDFVPGTLDHTTLPIMPTPDYATMAATKRLQSDFQHLLKVQQTTPLHELGWYIDPEKLDNVYQWIAELHSFSTFDYNKQIGQLPIAVEMAKQNIKSIVLEIRFNKDFPFSPPYIRVIRPRMLAFAQGGGGHIVMGGALCMELLTNSGWSSVSSMESVLMQVRLAIASTDNKDHMAHLERARGGGATNDYGSGEAAEGYLRACASHGWKVPEGFREMAYGGTRGG